MSALGQKQTCASQNVMSALPLKADMCGATTDVRFGPIADLARRKAVADIVMGARPRLDAAKASGLLARAREERSNGDDNGQDNHAVKVRCKRHGSDDIRSDQNFEPEQDGAAEVVAQAQIGTCIRAGGQRHDAATMNPPRISNTPRASAALPASSMKFFILIMARCPFANEWVS
jgi:hypothetical protein